MKLKDFGQIDQRDKEVNEELLDLQQALIDRRKANSLQKSERDMMDKKLRDYQKFSVKSVMASLTLRKVAKVSELKKQLFDLDEKISQDNYKMNELLVTIERLRKEENQLTLDRSRVKTLSQLLHEELMNGDSQQSTDYKSIYKDKLAFDNDKREVFEALSAGKRASTACQAAMESLSSAKKWGAYDALGGGRMAGIEKRDCVNEASDTMEKVGKLLIQFQKELADVNPSASFSKLSKVQKYVNKDISRDGLFKDVRSLLFMEFAGNNIADLKDSIDKALEGITELHDEVAEVANQQNQVVVDFISNIEFDEDEIMTKYKK